jgi:hypothetical protein
MSLTINIIEIRVPNILPVCGVFRSSILLKFWVQG